jgi:ankyrin repeat protein
MKTKLLTRIAVIVLCGLLLSSCSGITSNIIESTLKEITGNTLISEDDVILFRTIEKHNYEGVVEAVEVGANVSHFTEETYKATGYTSPLLLAMDRNGRRISRYLLDRGADPGYVDFRGRPLLFYAIGVPIGGVTHENHMGYTKLLLDHGANPDAKGKDGNSVLDCAILYGREEDGHQKILLDAGAGVTEKTVSIQLKVIEENTERAADFVGNVFCDVVREVFRKAADKSIDID